MVQKWGCSWCSGDQTGRSFEEGMISKAKETELKRALDSVMRGQSCWHQSEGRLSGKLLSKAKEAKVGTGVEGSVQGKFHFCGRFNFVLF